MTPQAMAAMMQRAYGAQGRVWSAEEIEALLGDPSVFDLHRPGGFALGRITGPEAELLMLVTDPARQRQGIARAILAAFFEHLASAGVDVVFLEVARDNQAALALYEGAGFEQVGCREGYYRREDALPVDALVLKRAL